VAKKQQKGGSQGRRHRHRKGKKERSALICVIVALSAQYGVSLALSYSGAVWEREGFLRVLSAFFS